MVCFLRISVVVGMYGLRCLFRTDAAAGAGVVGVPMCAIFDYAMGTPSGHAAFLDPDVNRMLKKILNEWGKYLKVSYCRLLAWLLNSMADWRRPLSRQRCWATTELDGSARWATKTSCRSPTLPTRHRTSSRRCTSAIRRKSTMATSHGMVSPSPLSFP